jgi:hypothetical protein
MAVWNTALGLYEKDKGFKTKPCDRGQTHRGSLAIKPYIVIFEYRRVTK